MDSGSAAISAKVRTLYGRMLTDADWEHLCRCSSVGELATALRGLPAWQQAMSELSPRETSTAALSSALRHQAADEYVRIYGFAAMQDKQYLLFAAYRYEMSLILANLRRILGRDPQPNLFARHEFFQIKCRLDAEQLNDSQNWESLCRACSRSIFASTLRAVPVGNDGLPEYPEVETALENRYYEAVFGFLTRKYTGRQKKRLTEYVGTQADLVNLTHLLRLKRYYPQTLENVESLFIPVRRYLTGEMIRAIAGAADESAVRQILRTSRWSCFFAEEDLVPERAYDRAMIAFCRRLLGSPEPGIHTAQAYLTLKQIECRRLLRVIEAVRLGVEPRRVL